MSLALINIDHYQKLEAKIIEDSNVGYYLIISPLGSERSIADYLCDSLEEAMDEAFEQSRHLAKDSWYYTEPVKDAFSLHDATICSIIADKGHFYIIVNGGKFKSEEADFCIKLSGVNNIEADGKIELSLEMTYPDGEVISADFADKEMKLIVEWNDFDAVFSLTKSYRLTCEGVSVHRKLKN
ncbi:hypothetical protein [Kangiella spongicola]|uniref:Uncharacterized protein n=1 Tax=Kangiella spongicola TaxID=796379 RepID=A0A318D1C3_9GAMM|nr:hypothetical protein [Kangiella spongicola]PXF63010.1 hypothetical protein DL796_06030 [Kangiella spongicola]